MNQIHHHSRGGESVLPYTHHRLALLLLLIYLVFVVSIPKYDLTAVIVFAFFPMCVLIAFSISIKKILVRLLYVSPFIITMALGNVFFDRRPFVVIGDYPITSGAISGLVIFFKSMVTFLTVMIFSQLVPFYRLCEVLRSLRVPDVFVTQLLLLYRYSFVLTDEAVSMQKARNLRSFGKNGQDLKTTAKLLGSLLLRTNNRADRIYRSMVARCMQTADIHQQKVHGTTAWDRTELFVLIFICLIFAMLRIIF